MLNGISAKLARGTLAYFERGGSVAGELNGFEEGEAQEEETESTKRKVDEQGKERKARKTSRLVQEDDKEDNKGAKRELEDEAESDKREKRTRVEADKGATNKEGLTLKAGDENT